MHKVSCPTEKVYNETKLSPMENLCATIKLLHDSGFDAYDLSLCDANQERRELFSHENFRESAHELRRYTDSVGLPCNQSHAFFPSSYGDERDEDIFQTLVENIETAAIVGAEIIVIHPKQHLCYAEHPRELFQMNVAFYKKLIPYAETFGIRIATENMWQYNVASHVPTDAVCSRAWEFCELIDAVDSPWLVGCLDLGHATLMKANVPDFIRAMGNRLQALHIHDVSLDKDSHTLPYTMKTDYTPILGALKEIGYQGDITFECHGFLQGFPKELLPSATRLMADIGKYFRTQIQ